MIVRAHTITIVLGPDWRSAYEIFGPPECVRVDGGKTRVLWSATRGDGGHIDFSVSWFTRDGWHVHATSRGTDPGLLLCATWREGGGLSVQVTSAGEGPAGMVEARRIDP
jgi:hypothetical protein